MPRFDVGQADKVTGAKYSCPINIPWFSSDNGLGQNLRSLHGAHEKIVRVEVPDVHLHGSGHVVMSVGRLTVRMVTVVHEMIASLGAVRMVHVGTVLTWCCSHTMRQ